MHDQLRRNEPGTPSTYCSCEATPRTWRNVDVGHRSDLEENATPTDPGPMFIAMVHFSGQICVQSGIFLKKSCIYFIFDPTRRLL
jgi:hypothetical protein